jgi:arsenite methyltransferase
MSYLKYKFTDDESFINSFDEAPLWSAAFGLLLLKHVVIESGSTIVDIGSGTGFPLFELAGRAGATCKLYGIDPWKNAMQRSRQKLESYGYSNVELIESGAEKIPLQDESVDLIVSNLGINNFEDPVAVFNECNRILKTGGRLALSTNIDGHWKLFYDIFERTLIELDKSENISKLNDQQRHRGSVESISRLFTDCGFKVTLIKEENMEMKFADGSAFLNHHFVKLGWLNSWIQLFQEDELESVFYSLENNLNSHARQNGGLVLDVPMVYIQGVKSNNS